ncbi:hypothetical protein [Methylobacterium sp. CM6247]
MTPLLGGADLKLRAEIVHNGCLSGGGLTRGRQSPRYVAKIFVNFAVSTRSPYDAFPMSHENCDAYHIRLTKMIDFHRIAIHCLVIADVLFSSRLYQSLLPDFAQRILLSTILLLSLIYFAIAVIRGHVLPVMIAVGAVSLVIGQMVVFSNNFSTQIDWNFSAQYIVFLSFLPIFVMSRDGMATLIAKVILAYALIYTLVYAVIGILYSAGLLPGALFTALLLNDAERGDRLFAYAGALAFAFYYSMGALQKNFTIKNLAIMMLCVAANYFTLSRVYLLCLTIVAVMNIVKLPRRIIALTSFGGFAIVSVGLLYGMADHSWNPFYAFASQDTSGFGRALEYQVLQDILPSNFVFGLGIPGAPGLGAQVTGLSFFASGDLGAVGVFCDLGLIGLLFYIIAAAISCSEIHIMQERFSTCFFQTGCMMVLYGSIAPVLFAPGGVFYFSAILGIWLAQELRVTSLARNNLHGRVT